MTAVGARRLELRHGERPALDVSDFDIPSGTITAVIGPNGSGKSTLLQAVSGLLDIASGTLRVLGEDPQSARRRVAYVLQTTRINETAPITVREVVSMGRYPNTGLIGRLSGEDRRRIDAAIARMGLEDLARSHLRELSGGQRQRVFIAQGLAQDHDLLLLDEPLTGLDLPSTETIDQVIHEEQRHGCTVILTTHDLAEARAADHVLLLSGRVVASGPPSQVLTPKNLELAYGSGVHPSAGEFLDDPAHRSALEAHTHRDRPEFERRVGEQ